LYRYLHICLKRLRDDFVDGNLDMTVGDRLTDFLAGVIVPMAERLDQDGGLLATALQGLGDRHFLGLRVPLEYGGSELSSVDYYGATVQMAAASGILAFLQTQHQSAAAQIAQFGSEEQKKLLPSMVTGELKIGVGFSHLRRRGTPLLQAMPQGEGFRLSGVIPWVTGYGFFQRAIAGATLPNGDELYGLIPLSDETQRDGGKIDCGEPLALAAMGASRTVAVRLERWYLAPEDVLVIKPAGSIHQGDRPKVLHHGFFALGCAQGCLNFLESLENIELGNVAGLRTRFMALHDAMFAAIANGQSQFNFEHHLQLRIKAVAIAQEYAQIALIAAGGAGNLLSHPAQRLHRESLMFSVFGQTETIRNATLQSLIPNKCSRYTEVHY
jgi:hypothetical protein